MGGQVRLGGFCLAGERQEGPDRLQSLREVGDVSRDALGIAGDVMGAELGYWPLAAEPVDEAVHFWLLLLAGVGRQGAKVLGCKLVES